MDIIAKQKGITILFLCQCNGNVSKSIDFDVIRKWAKGNPEIDIIVTGNLLCSPKEKELFSKIIRGSNKFVKKRTIDNIIVAACSPKVHEKTFQDILEAEGINIAKIQMANIREQCAWVTQDIEEATKKAVSLINGAIRRSVMSKDLSKQKMKVLSDVLIIGGGVAGIEAARTMSKAGRKVYIVEKNIAIGGHIIKTEEVAPNMECAPCLLAPILSEIKDDPNIEVISNAEVESVIGFFGNFSVSVKQNARYIKDNCIACGECYEVCPVSVPNDFHNGLGMRKAVYHLFDGSVPATAVIDKNSCLHFKDDSCNECVSSCPFQSINFNDLDKELEIKVGAIMVSTGFQSGELSDFSNLSYGALDDVITIDEFERLTSSNGPFEGELKLKNGKVPQSIAVVHCAGSLTDKGLSYCSNICCTNACKVGALARITNPKVNIIHIHKDLVFSNPSQYQFYREQINNGTQFLKTDDLSSIKIVAGKSMPISIEAKGVEAFEVEMVVLVTGLKAASGTDELANCLNIELDENGYLKPDHPVAHTTGTILDGIYMAGCVMRPGNVSDAMTQALAVSGDILCKLIPGKEIELEMLTSYIDERICAGCKLCIASCPYQAIFFDEEKKISVVNQAICRGCGTCAASCPSHACLAKHFLDEQIYAELGGVLNVK